MSATTTGALVGATLALTWVVVGFWAFVLVAVAMLIGAAIGRIAEGRLDVRALADAVRGRRSSS